MNFTPLDKRLESFLFEIKKHVGCSCTFYLSENEFSGDNIKALIERGFLQRIDDRNYSFTYIANNYTELKKDYERQTLKIKIQDNVRYLITTLIALSALIVAIIALFK